MNSVFAGNDRSPAPGCYLNHATGTFSPEIVGDSSMSLFVSSLNTKMHTFSTFCNKVAKLYQSL